MLFAVLVNSKCLTAKLTYIQAKLFGASDRFNKAKFATWFWLLPARLAAALNCWVSKKDLK